MAFEWLFRLAGREFEQTNFQNFKYPVSGGGGGGDVEVFNW